MTSTELNIIVTDENIDAIEDQMTPDNEVATIDCMALNPPIAEQVNSGFGRPAEYELQIFKVEVEDQEVFLLYFEDGDTQDTDSFAERAHFYENEADAKAAMGAEYNDWLTRF